jgi:hypothetical protein
MSRCPLANLPGLCSNEPRVPMLMPSRRLHQVYLFCYTKCFYDRIKENCALQCCGCEIGSLSQGNHLECVVSKTFSLAPLDVNRGQVEESVNTICAVEALPAPHDIDFNLLWHKCQFVWRNLVRRVLMGKFEMFPQEWVDYVSCATCAA